MPLLSLSKRVKALEPLPPTDWGEFLDTLDDAELERLEAIAVKLPPPIEGDRKSDAELEAWFSVLDAEENAYLDQIVMRRFGLCAA